MWLEICSICGFDPRGYAFSNIIMGVTNAAGIVRPFSIGVEGDLESSVERLAETGADNRDDSPLELLHVANKKAEQDKHIQDEKNEEKHYESIFKIPGTPKLKPPGSTD